MTKNLIEWAADQLPWTSDSLRRIALAVDHFIEADDLEAICQSVRHAAGYSGTPAPLTPLDGTHLGNGSDDVRRTTLTQIGPVQNIDRLAEGQSLRMAPNGITLVYGENGSGKSGYTRIAKSLCRSLSIDELRGNVFAGAAGPMQVGVRYQVGDDEITELEWNPGTAPPSVLRQISVFDSQNARLYVAGDNRIAYLPRRVSHPRTSRRNLPTAGHEVRRRAEGAHRSRESAIARRLHRGDIGFKGTCPAAGK